MPLKVGAGRSFDTSTDTLSTAAAGGNVSSANAGTSTDGAFALWSGTGGLTIKNPPPGNGFNASTGDLNFVTGTTGSINLTPSASGTANLKQAVLVDPVNPTNTAAFNLQIPSTPSTPTTRSIFIPLTLSGTVLDTGTTPPPGDLFVKGYDATSGSLTSAPVMDNNIHHNTRGTSPRAILAAFLVVITRLLLATLILTR